jgi:hypothetical protein
VFNRCPAAVERRIEPASPERRYGRFHVADVIEVVAAEPDAVGQRGRPYPRRAQSGGHRVGIGVRSTAICDSGPSTALTRPSSALRSIICAANPRHWRSTTLGSAI